MLQLLLQITVVFYHKTGKHLLQKGASITNGTKTVTKYEIRGVYYQAGYSSTFNKFSNIV